MKSRLFIVVAELVLGLIVYSSAQVPQLINYQGKLTKASGAPVDTTISMVYTIYSDSNGITSKWSEAQTAVKVEKGVFNVLLGSVNLIPDSVFDGSVRYLGVKVGSDPEITPRKAMVSVPYAYRAGVGGGYWTFRVTDGADTTLITGSRWGVARYGNALYGSADSTHVNLGVACTTGTSGQNYKYCTVGGGSRNTASGGSATVGGGLINTASGYHATVGGGAGNTASGINATVGGGVNNAASENNATVGGGDDNAASGYYATVGGGMYDTASGSEATVGGGELNIASGTGASVLCGFHNTASGLYATVEGGYNNSNSGANCVIPGGSNDTLTTAADHSLAFGYMVYVNSSFKVVFFDGSNSGRLGINRDDHDGGILYPIHVGTSASNGNGAYLTNGGVWTNGSSRTFKEKFQTLNNQELLQKISSLPVEAWNFKNSPERHIGPVAEDFVSAFDVGAVREDGTRDNKYLSTEDIAGVALAGVKELIKENQEQKQENQELRQMIDKLSQKITELEKAR